MVDKSYTNKKKEGKSVSASEARSPGARKLTASDFEQGQGQKFTSTKRQFGGVKKGGE